MTHDDALLIVKAIDHLTALTAVYGLGIIVVIVVTGRKSCKRLIGAWRERNIS